MPHASALVRDLLVSRANARSGVLTVRSDAGASCRIYLRAGAVVFADDDPSRSGAGFSKRLLREKVLTAEQAARAAERAAPIRGRHPSVKLGEAAVALGFLRVEAMRTTLGNEVRASLVRTLQRADVTWELDDSEAPLAEIIDVPLQIEAQCLDAVRWLDDESKRAFGLGAVLDRRLRIDPSVAPSVARRFELSADEAAFLGRLDGTRTASELVAARDTTIDVDALLTALVATRVALAEGGTPSGQMRAVTPGPISVGRPAASIPASRPPGSTPSPRPPSSIPASRPSGSTPAARPSQVMRALEAQKRSLPRRATVEEKRLAETTVKSAVAQAKTRGWASMAAELHRASDLDPDNLEYKTYAKYAAMRASHEPAHPVQRTELRRLALTAVKVNPDFAFGYVVGAEMMVDDGESEPAHRMLTRALKLEPSQADALRLMRIVERRISTRPRG